LFGRVTCISGSITSSCWVLIIDQSWFSDADRERLTIKLPTKAAREPVYAVSRAEIASLAASLEGF